MLGLANCYTVGEMEERGAKKKGVERCAEGGDGEGEEREGGKEGTEKKANERMYVNSKQLNTCQL